MKPYMGHSIPKMSTMEKYIEDPIIYTYQDKYVQETATKLKTKTKLKEKTTFRINNTKFIRRTIKFKFSLTFSFWTAIF